MGICPEGTKRYNHDDGVKSLAECNIQATEGDEALMPKVADGINVALGIVGVIAVVMIIVGGINYTTSQGDAGKVKKARDTIIYGVIGLVVALLAFAIVSFVLNGVFGNDTSTSTTSTSTSTE